MAAHFTGKDLARLSRMLELLPPQIPGWPVPELPHARLLRADSILEMRLSPERLTHEIAAFLDACWMSRPRSGNAGARRRRVA